MYDHLHTNIVNSHYYFAIHWSMYVSNICYVKLLCMNRAKFLSKSFIASTLRLSCLRTNNELSLGELIHLKCIHFSKYFARWFAPESSHTWIKTAESDAVFSKVFFLSVFAGYKIEEKYHVSFSPNNEVWALESSERSHEAQKGPRGAPSKGGRAPQALLALERRLGPSFGVPPYIPKKT